MNHYTLAEMVPGLSEEFTVTVTLLEDKGETQG